MFIEHCSIRFPKKDELKKKSGSGDKKIKKGSSFRDDQAKGEILGGEGGREDEQKVRQWSGEERNCLGERGNCNVGNGKGIPNIFHERRACKIFGSV